MHQEVWQGRGEEFGLDKGKALATFTVSLFAQVLSGTLEIPISLRAQRRPKLYFCH